VLIHLDPESLRDLGFVKVGQRLRLMRLINDLMGLADHFDLADSNPKMMGSFFLGGEFYPPKSDS
jgi:hypothetical protein